MPSDDQGLHAERPARKPLRHILPRRWQRRPDPFVATDETRAVLSNAKPEETRSGSDGWAAAKGALLFILGAALVTWVLITLLR